MNYYNRKDIQEELLRISKNREVQIWINDIRGKRPEVVNFLGDVNSLVRDGMTSLHISVERWKDPLRLKSGMSKKELDDLRLGFDLLLDLDSKHLEYSKVTAELLMEALKFHDVKDVSIKFSVTGDTPILIKSDNYTKLVPISEAIKLYKSGKKLKVLSLDKGAYLNFLDVSGSLSHVDKVYNIYHEQSGLPIKATGYHSVFCWDKGDIIQKKVSEIKNGDNLVSFISSNKIKYNKKNITNKFTYLGTDKKISINVTKDLMRLIGYYLAEGHATKINSMVGFSFNKNEKMYINDVKNIIKSLPGFNSTIRDAYPNKGSHQIIINSKEWFSFFNDFCGVRDNKHIPDFVWDLPTNYFLELLLGYIRGDAHKRSPRYLTIKSVSHKLTTELIWLCKMHGISCNLYEEFNKPHTLPQGNWFKGSHVFMIKILKSDFPLLEHNTKRNKLTAYPASRTYPIDGLKEVYHIIKPGKFLSHRNEQMTLSKKRANINRILKVIKWFESDHYLPINSHCKNIIQKYKDLEKQDICVLEVRKIIKKQKKEKVYDISVKDTERFFGGYYPILLHNSGNHGFHIAIPYESFPDTLKGQKLNLLYPEIIRIIASYLKEMIKPHLTERLLKLDSIEEIARKSGKTKAEIIKDEQFDPFTVVDIDTILIYSRHMFRAPYSVAYDEPILIEKDKRIKIQKIGEFVDQFFKDKNNFQDLNISNLNYKVISADLNSIKTKFSKITSVIRHKINEPLFLVKLEGGRTIRVTSGHSLFKLSEGKIDTVKGNKIKVGDYLIVTRKLPSKTNFRRGDFLFISDEILHYLSENEKKKTYLSNFNKNIFEELYKNKLLFGKRGKYVYNWKRYNLLPLDIYESLIKKNNLLKKQFKNSKIKFMSHGGGAKFINNKLIVDEHLLGLLGYYTAEGHSDKLGKRKNRVCFSFGSHESKLIMDCVNKICNVFKLKPKIVSPHKTAKQIVVTSSTLCLLFKCLFSCGRTAKKKRIPSIVWLVEDKLKEIYLTSYLKGDGHRDKKWSRNSATTVSKALKEDLCFLCSMLGLNYLLYEQDVKGISHKTSLANQFIISGKEDIKKLGFDSSIKGLKEGLINLFPLKEIGLDPFMIKSRFRNEYYKKNILRRSKKWIKSSLDLSKHEYNKIIKFLDGDLSYFRVRSITKEKSKHKFVYDLSVEKDENFVGGNCILLHNSINEKSGLISIPLKDIKTFNIEDAKPENVKTDVKFLDYDNVIKGSANQLLLQAYDWSMKKETVKVEDKKLMNIPTREIKEDFFPPCISSIMKGLPQDGRKRSVFILLNFLNNMNWPVDKIEAFLLEWNKKNYEPLKEGYIKAQILWFKKQNTKILPANCDNPAYYRTMGICNPDNLCSKVKNPVNYSIRKINFVKNKKAN